MAKKPTPIQDFEQMTDDIWLIAAYFDWKRDEPVYDHLHEKSVDRILQILKGKRAINETTKTFRTACMNLRDQYQAVHAARASAEKKAERLLDKIGYYFDLKELMWKDIKKKCDSPQTIGRASKAQRVYGRCLGQILFDVTAVPTGLWSIEALRNLVNGNDKKGNTDEHYMSLHANAGPDMLLDALSMDVQFDIDHFCFLIFKNIQTNRTTCSENMNLSTFHKQYSMKSPQDSYEQAEVSQLVQVGQVARMRQVWDVIFEDFPRVNQSDAEAPFDNVLTLEQAIELYPELEPLRNHKF